MTFPRLETDRLILRQLQLTDLDDLFEYAQDPDVYKMGMWQPYDDYEAAKNDLETLISYYDRGLMWWAIEHKADSKMIGRVQISEIDRDDHHAEISYALNKNYWRQGIAIETTRYIVNYAFAEMNLNRLYARTLIDNENSYKLLEKLGFQREGHLREHTWTQGYAEDVYIYGLLKSDVPNV